MEASWLMFRPYRWSVERSEQERSTQKGCCVNLPELWSANPLWARHAGLTHRFGEVPLDNAFVLIEGHQGSVAKPNDLLLEAVAFVNETWPHCAGECWRHL